MDKINRVMDRITWLPGYIVAFLIWFAHPVLIAIAITIGYAFVETFLVAFLSALFRKEVDEDGQAR